MGKWKKCPREWAPGHFLLLLQSEPVHFVLFYILGFHVNPGKTTTNKPLFGPCLALRLICEDSCFLPGAEPWGTTFLMLRACDPHGEMVQARSDPVSYANPACTLSGEEPLPPSSLPSFGPSFFCPSSLPFFSQSTSWGLACTIQIFQWQ